MSDESIGRRVIISCRPYCHVVEWMGMHICCSKYNFVIPLDVEVELIILSQPVLNQLQLVPGFLLDSHIFSSVAFITDCHCHVYVAMLVNEYARYSGPTMLTRGEAQQFSPLSILQLMI